MGQEGFVPIRPEMRINRLETFVGRDLDDRAPAALEALFKELRKDLFQRLAVQVIE
jgi:hypothetical protein